jgi:hypothetical protein
LRQAKRFLRGRQLERLPPTRVGDSSMRAMTRGLCELQTRKSPNQVGSCSRRASKGAGGERSLPVFRGDSCPRPGLSLRAAMMCRDSAALVVRKSAVPMHSQACALERQKLGLRAARVWQRAVICERSASASGEAHCWVSPSGGRGGLSSPPAEPRGTRVGEAVPWAQAVGGGLVWKSVAPP